MILLRWSRYWKWNLIIEYQDKDFHVSMLVSQYGKHLPSHPSITTSLFVIFREHELSRGYSHYLGNDLSFYAFNYQILNNIKQESPDLIFGFFTSTVSSIYVEPFQPWKSYPFHNQTPSFSIPIHRNRIMI